MSEVCFACGDEIEEGDWVIPLKTYRAAYSGDNLVMNASETCETVVCADCIGSSGEEADDE